LTQKLSAERKGVTLYSHLASVLRGRIRQADWKQGDQLPSIPELCKMYGVAIITVRQALAELSAEGLVNSARGRGTFVTANVISPSDNENLRDAINDPLGLAPGQTIQLLLREPATGLPAALKTGQPEYPAYVRIRTIHRHHGEPYGLMDIYVAKETYDRFPKGAVERRKVWYLVRNHSLIHLTQARQEITVAYADQETAGLLASNSVDYNMAGILVRARRWWTDDDQRIAYAGLYLYRADMFVLDVTQALANSAPGEGLIPTVREDASPARAPAHSALE
jgi:DNA-binding GntR family transcriptional regulator